MAEVLYRQYRHADIPALISLWESIFGDGPEVVSGFFKVLPEIGSCFVAEQDSRIAGMASVITDLTLKGGCSSTKCAYIYAVAVEYSFRGAGIGGTLSRMAADFGRKNGARIISTLPANEGLYSMYEKTAGLERTLRREKTVFSGHACAAESQMVSVSPVEYNRKREEILSKAAHLSVSDKCIEFLKTLCNAYGGDLYAGENFCAAMYISDDSVFFPELLCPDSETSSFLALGASMKNKVTSYCYRPSDEGERYIAYAGDLVYHNPVWNITFE
ncbi:MAG: GNAT family N-acetyltransferase [Oscillospiraceae bacterium]|nr:GNAT family N-acetyltransferase [Oscillospiraceae bacterium]